MASFWLVDVLAMQGRIEEAERRFAHVLSRGNDLGLFAEEYDPVRREHLGNFPQAFTHLALVHSAAQRARAPATESTSWPPPIGRTSAQPSASPVRPSTARGGGSAPRGADGQIPPRDAGTARDRGAP